ncbi:hypothetical protein U9M48_041323 [Paspalum notatum var. saurae]|uniref:PHD-type domain-containing protein n=1 Tax=Paspalum notatum var. saurae TaxID=547442 RepID=A0AAQ3UNI9_PASNO
MASEGAASRRPPLPPPPKRRAARDLLLHSGAGVLTYKRRRRATTATASADKNQAGNSQQGGNQALARHWASWRDVLQGVLRSPAVSQGSGGIQTCIRDALKYNGCQPVPADHGNLGEGRGAGGENPSGAARAKENGGGALVKAQDATGGLVKSEDAAAAALETNRAMCHSALFDILVSEKFALLCDLLAATFHVSKPDDVIGLEKIDAKMRNGDYTQNPELIHQDIKQIWKKFEQVSQEMASLAISLSAISQASYQKQASGVSEIDVAEHKIEETSLVGVANKALRESTPPCDSGHSTIPKLSGTSGPDGICKDCGSKADSGGRIICDRCEAAYHVSCLKLPIDEEVPAKWYCSTCSELGVAVKNNNNGRSHEDCDVCNWLEVKKPEEDAEAVSQVEVAVKTQESSVSSKDEDSEPDLSTTALSKLCKHCGTCEDEGKKFLVCGHPYCAYKYYHVVCLRESQIASEKQKKRACWYCPSCLCRGCFKAKDDEYTVLCDGCDDAYHIYCMNPPRESIPKGHWYCTWCSARRSADAMQRYEKSILKRVPAAKSSKAPAVGAPENK